VDARQSDDFVIIARTDSIAAEGVEAAIDRGKAYFDAGADGLFVEAFQTVEQIRAVGAAFPGKPLVFNRTPRGFSPLTPMADLGAAGFALVIFPMHLVLAAAAAGQKLLREVRETGTTDSFEDVMMNVNDFFNLVGKSRLEKIEDRFAKVGAEDPIGSGER
jgi:2-methylisocitrate lyase-like PEP mutase family enzyme